MNFNRSILIICAFILIFSAISCSLKGDASGSEVVNRSEVVNLRIDHHRATAFGFAPTLVMLSQEDEQIGSENWLYFYDWIEGFEYEPGFIYDLRVRKYYIENPLQDGSSIRYVLDQLISKTEVPADEVFEIKLKWGQHNFVEKDNERLLINQKIEINCETLCEELISRLEQDEQVVGNFVRESSDKIKLVLIQ